MAISLAKWYKGYKIIVINTEDNEMYKYGIFTNKGSLRSATDTRQEALEFIDSLEVACLCIG